jgi:protein-L-isoaspartate O-methyltransferase
MRKAIKMWDTSKYWTDRAAGAVRHAKYKERPDVRARRIKTLEADKRGQERTIAESQKFLKAWSREGLTEIQARTIANFDHVTVYYKKDQYPASTYEGASSIYSGLTSGLIDVAKAVAICIPFHKRVIHGANRWLRHYENRIAYERAMLGENGGTIADRTKPEKGGACRCWASPPGGWSYIQKVNKVSVSVLDTYGNGGRSFTRTIPFGKLTAVMSAADVREKRDAGFLIESAEGIGFFLMQPPLEKPQQEDPEAALRRIWDAKGVSKERQDELIAEVTAKAQPRAKVGPFTLGGQIEAMRETLKDGVRVISAPQLFPTPPHLAARMVELAQIEPGHRVLEPSAGTGVLCKAITAAQPTAQVFAVEINTQLCELLSQNINPPEDAAEGICKNVLEGDFLEVDDLGNQWDRIVMNPPFADGADIKHISHALKHLKPGGRLVAICANGPRQNEKLRPVVEAHDGLWQELPADTFMSSGTSVRTVLLSMTASEI